MAHFTYEQIVNTQKTQGAAKSNVTYLSTILAKSGDSIYVRFPYKSTKEFEIVSVHKTQVNGKYRNVCCLRENFFESADKCPLCSAKDENGAPIFGAPKLRFIVKMIAYKLNSDGNVEEIIPCILEQPARMRGEASPIVKTLATYIEDYKDLTHVPLKITRNGEGLNTTYVITPINANVWNEEVLPVDFSGFDNYNFSGHAYLEKTYDELMTFVETGDLPSPHKEETQTQMTIDDEVQFEVREEPRAYTQPSPSYTQPARGTYTQQTTTTTDSYRPARSPKTY